MTTNQTITSSLAYISDKLFPKTLQDHVILLKLLVAPDSLANGESAIWQSMFHTV